MAEATGFLYPFLDAGPEDPSALLDDLSRSATAKWSESVELRRSTLSDLASELEAAADAAAARLAAGGRIIVFGNGGSATDADAFVQTCGAAEPSPLPSICLADEPAVLTALANDIGVDAIFARQLAAHGRAGDVAVAFTTSGGSTNVLAALRQARTAGLLTIALAGYGGGAVRSVADHCLAVASDSVHRIQETQVVVADALVERISRLLGERRT